MEWDVESILTKLGIKYVSMGSRRKITGFSSITEAKDFELSFCWYQGKKGRKLISDSNSGVILCEKIMENLVQAKEGTQLIFLDNPRLVFIQILGQIQNTEKLMGISSKAIISKDAKIGRNCYIGDFTKIGNHCTIADNTIIHENVSILQYCSIGHDCIIQTGAVMGSDGFAFERYKNGTLCKFPHNRGIKIGNHVEVGANSFIARGSLSDTIIGEGTKIDALVHIAHNVIVGQNCQLAAGTIIGGSTKIGNMCWTGLNSTLRDNIEIGNNVIVGAGAMVIGNVQDNDIVAGVPARSIKHKVRSNKLFLMAGQDQI
jgi:UDP-3-O-[3-hydroxymyristoyl] glucosamine N-acyltransferase